MYEIVSNVINATSFMNRDVCSASFRKLNVPELEEYSLTLSNFNNLSIVKAFNDEGVFCGYLKISNVASPSKNIVVDGECETICENDILAIEN